MNINKLTATVCAAAGFAAGAVFVSPVLAQHQGHNTTSGTMRQSAGSQQLHAIMMDGAKKMQNMKMMGEVDRDFAMMMAQHHADGIKMADVEIRHGKNAQLKAMARKIKAAQTKERADLLKHANMKH